jgi:uncharacterized protein YbaR (Trm112 family)/SAM-dependent methyltransferase
VRADLPAILPLICIGCRRVAEGRMDLYSVDLETTARADGDEVLEGVLRCGHCGKRYPIVDGIPIMVPDPGAWLGRELVGLVDPELGPEVLELLAAPGPDDAPMARLAELLSIYLDAHWGDRATPPPDGPPARGELWAKVGARSVRVAAAVELGCSVGRGLHELSRRADLTVGVDTNLAALRRARRIVAGAELRYARRAAGRHYTAARIGAAAAPGRVELVCADAQDPPLPPRRFNRVAALNVVDVVHDPVTILGVVEGLCSPGGEVILASPYAWQSGFVGEGHRIGAHDPGREVVRRLEEWGLGLEEESNIEWVLRRDARSAATYVVHYLRLSKPLLT